MAYLDPIAGARRASGSGLASVAGAPVAGTDEIQTVDTTGVPDGGTFKLGFKGQTSAALDWDATAAEVDAALGALATIGGAANVTCAGGPLPTAITVTFVAALGKKVQPLLTVDVNALSGGTAPTVTVVETTPGVAATHRGAAPGTLIYRADTNVLLVNTGTAIAPTWTAVGGQT